MNTTSEVKKNNMKVKYKCIVELECSPELPEATPEKIEQLVSEYKKRLDDGLEKGMEDAIRDNIVEESDHVHVERVYLTFE